MRYYFNFLDKRDLVIVCSRNPYDLIASGVLHWREFWIKSNNYSESTKISHYRKVINRTLNDFLEVKGYIGQLTAKVFLSDLEKLSNLKYLNKINKILSIEIFNEYPNSTVLGIKRGGDLLSQNQNSKSYGTFDPFVVNRGNPFSRLGIIDSMNITLISSKRIEKYKFKPKLKLLNNLINLNYPKSCFIFSLILMIPTKIEILYYKEYFVNIFLLIKSKKLSFKQKVKQLFLLFVNFGLYPFEFLLI